MFRKFSALYLYTYIRKCSKLNYTCVHLKENVTGNVQESFLAYKFPATL